MPPVATLVEDPLAIRHPNDVGLNSRLEVATMELRERVIQSIKQYAEDNNVPVAQAITDLEVPFAEVGKSVAKMVDYCKEKGLLTIKAPRGKKRKSDESNEVNEDDTAPVGESAYV